MAGLVRILERFTDDSKIDHIVLKVTTNFIGVSNEYDFKNEFLKYLDKPQSKSSTYCVDVSTLDHASEEFYNTLVSFDRRHKSLFDDKQLTVIGLSSNLKHRFNNDFHLDRIIATAPDLDSYKQPLCSRVST